jgi:Mrp family chromosome partitioning ATPase
VSAPTFSVDGVLDALAAQPRRGAGEGRAVMLVSARRGEGVTTAACAVARRFSASVYAIDLDLRRNAFARALSAEEPLGPKIDGRLNGKAFYTLTNALGARLEESRPAFSYHRVGHGRVFAGVFDARVLPAAAKVTVSSAPDYWDAARAGGACVVLDAPALERSQIALRVARHMDGIVLVVADDAGAAPAAIAAKAALVAAGANVIGLIYSGARTPVLAMDRAMRKAG